MAEVRYKRALESIAVKIRDLAVAAAPKDTGNLRNRIKAANTPAKTKMIKTTDDLKEISISLDYAPIGAEYGQWFNDPPEVVSKQRQSLKATAQRKGNWNYAMDAINDTELDKKFNDLLDALGDYIVDEIEIELDK
jgi:hypothetical protein